MSGSNEEDRSKTKAEQLKALRERGQGGVRVDKQKRAMRQASDRPAKAITKSMLDAVRAAAKTKQSKGE